MRSHEARPSSVPPKLELGGAVNTDVPPVKTLEGIVPPAPHDLRHCVYAYSFNSIRTRLQINVELINVVRS